MTNLQWGEFSGERERGGFFKPPLKGEIRRLFVEFVMDVGGFLQEGVVADGLDVFHHGVVVANWLGAGDDLDGSFVEDLFDLGDVVGGRGGLDGDGFVPHGAAVLVAVEGVIPPGGVDGVQDVVGLIVVGEDEAAVGADAGQVVPVFGVFADEDGGLAFIVLPLFAFNAVLGDEGVLGVGKAVGLFYDLKEPCQPGVSAQKSAEKLLQ